MATINRRAVIEQITGAVSQHRHAIIDRVQTNKRFFNKDTTTLCFLFQDEKYYTFVEPTLEYLGNNAAVRGAFAQEVHKGWIQVLIPASSNLEISLRLLDALLGLDGGEPRILWPQDTVTGANRMHGLDRHQIRTRTVQDTDYREQIEKRRSKTAISEDLVALAEKGRLEEPIGRDSIIDAVIQVVSKSKKNSCMLIGESGVGKTAIVEGLAIRIHKRAVPVSMLDKRICSINMGHIAAEATHYNQLLARVKEIVDEAKRDERIILFVDEAHMLADPKHDVSQILKADLGRNLRVIAATTNKEYHQYIAPDEAFARRFQRIPVPEMSPETCLQVLQKAKENYERHHYISIPDELLPWIIKVSVRFVKDRVLPDKALDLLDEASARLRLSESNSASPLLKVRQTLENKYNVQSPAEITRKHEVFITSGTTLFQRKNNGESNARHIDPD